jgi:multiple sugar transport system permease protein
MSVLNSVKPRRRLFSIYEWFSNNIKIVFILPSIIFVLLMMVFPIVYTVWLSLTEWSGSAKQEPRFVGISNYVNLFTTDTRFVGAVIRTFAFTIAAVGLELLFGLGIALLMWGKFRGQNIIRTLILLPMVSTPVAIGMAWLLLYEPSIGFINSVLRFFKLPPQPWLGSEQQALWSLAAVDIWQWTPMMVLIILAGLTVLPEEPFEAAIVDGATAFQRFRHLTLPLMVPTIIVAILLRSIDCLKTFDIIFAMTRGGPGFATETLNTYTYVQSFEYFRLGQASSLLVVFFVIVLLVSLFFIQLRNRWGKAI